MGPLISSVQRDRVERKLEALDADADVVTGGGRPYATGYFLEPTVVANVPADNELVRDETFGPVFTVQQFADEAEGWRWRTGRDTGSPRRSGRATSVERRVPARASRREQSGSTTT
jgi:betaine-aldehyde dehydrogenase